MRNVRLIIGLSVLVTCLAGVPAEGTEWGKDPFFPSTSRPAAPTPSPDDKDWGRDPFDNPFGRKTTYQQPGARNLTGIIYGKTVRLAIIGGEVLGEGSTVDRWDIDSTVVDGEMCVVEWVFACTVDGASHAFDGATTATVRDGRIVRLREYRSTEQPFDADV